MHYRQLTICILVVSIIYLDAFLSNPRPSSRPNNANHVAIREDDPFFRLKASSNEDESLGHGDILWKVWPTARFSRLKRLWLWFAANLIRLDCMIKRQEPPVVLCPKGGQALLEACYRPNNSSKYEKIARFGFTTVRGPSDPAIQETVQDIYGLGPNVMVGGGAIIFMLAATGSHLDQVPSIEEVTRWFQ